MQYSTTAAVVHTHRRTEYTELPQHLTQESSRKQENVKITSASVGLEVVSYPP